MNMIAAVQSGYRNFLNFSGRARRPEYWWWFLFQVIVSIIIIVIEGGGTTATTAGGFSWNYEAGSIQMVWCLANLLPGLAVSVRRMHDLDKSGWWLLIGVIPLVGAIVLLTWCGTKGTVGPNRFGAERPA